MIELKALRKVFGAVVANADVSLKIERGSIHAIIGENGAGKSTAMKMLYGIYPPDSGEIFVEGRLCHWRSPRDAIAAGIGMVHQHFMLAAPYSVFENIVLGVEPLWPAQRQAMREKIKALSAQYGLAVDLDAKIEDLPVGIQQRVEILKLLYQNARILIFDEPTAVLTPQEARNLFANLKKLKSEGKTCILITHKLKEVMEASDQVTIFRAGAVVGEVKTSETSVDELASLMVGRKVSLRAERGAFEAKNVAGGGSKETGPVLRVKNLSLKSSLRDLSFEIAPGEIVGIAGIEGNGQSELLQVLLHPKEYHKKMSGEVSWLGVPSLSGSKTLSNSEIRALGVGCVPEDRHQEAVLLKRPALESFLLGFQRRSRFKKSVFIDSSRLAQAAAEAFESFDIRPRDPALEMSKFSGGNQQKLVIAREFEFSPRALIAAHPTRGVDVGAIEFIHAQILKARAKGLGVLLVSSELDEILALSDRVLVIYEGRIVGEFKHEEFSTGQVTEMDLGRCMTGVAK